MVTTRAGTTTVPAPAPAPAPSAHSAAAQAPPPAQGQAQQQHHAQWMYGGDNRVSWAPLRADLSDLVEAAWQQGLPSVSYQYAAGKDYQVRWREGEGGREESV